MYMAAAWLILNDHLQTVLRLCPLLLWRHYNGPIERLGALHGHAACRPIVIILGVVVLAAFSSVIHSDVLAELMVN